MKNGFTLIELLVAVSVMMVVLGGGIASYITFNERQKVATSARELQQVFHSAQIKARAGEKPATCTGRLDAYRIIGADGGSTVSLVALCTEPTTQTTIQTLSLQDGITLNEALQMEYKTLHGGVTGSGTVQLNSTFGIDYSFSVDAGGAVSTGDYL